MGILLHVVVKQFYTEEKQEREFVSVSHAMLIFQQGAKLHKLKSEKVERKWKKAEYFYICFDLYSFPDRINPI